MAASTMDMSAQQAQHAPVRLLIAERSENAAYQFDSLLRDAGIATRVEVIDLPMAVDKLPQADMLLCNAALPELHQLLPRLTSLAPRAPIIVINNDEASLTQSEGMELGAADVVSDAEPRHLVMVIKRELEHICQNIQLKQTRKALREAEQRCQLLLQSSRAAIAYVHEGMHIYANEGYLKLFGFEGADDLLGLPLIDLLDSDSASALKDKLKKFRQNGEESDFDFVGQSSDGTTISANMTLAAAEYEGEHCLQVTVRSGESQEQQPVAAATEADQSLLSVESMTSVQGPVALDIDDSDDVPVLQEDAIVGADVDRSVADVDRSVADVDRSVAAADDATAYIQDSNGAAVNGTVTGSVDGAAIDSTTGPGSDKPTDAEAAGNADQAGSIDFELVLEGEATGQAAEAEVELSADPDTAVDDTEPSSPPALVDVAAPEINDDALGEATPDATETLPEAAADKAQLTGTNIPAESKAANGAAMGLPDFLAATEQVAARHEGQFISIFVARIDGYEDLQRAFGLAGVDDACRQVEARLQDTVAGPFMQISPFQWAMMVCDKTREDALKQVNGYRASVESMMFEVREKTVRPTCTFGGAILNLEGFDSIGTALEATLDNAFTTLRASMESGKGNTVKLPQFENADQEFDDEANRVLVLISEAIENQSFTLLFQPIISLRGDSDEHYEVFLRMNDRNGKQMAPGEFLRTAIDNGVAGKIDRWVILQSIKMLSSHRANGHNTRLTINLTSNSVADPEFIQWLGVAIKAARLPSDAVIFQITERDASTYIRQTREFVEGLKNLHCRSSLSRFGLAEEPFEVLGHIPVDFVKFDGTLIEALDNDPSQKAAVTEMVRELQNAGKLTIVPMVESAGLLSTLWQAGVNYIQGHYLQEPSTNMDYDFSTDD